MCKQIIIILSLFCLSFNAFAIDVEGRVVLYNNKTKGVSGVFIVNEYREASEATDSYGYFKIQFSSELDRKQVRLKVSLPKTGEYKNYIVMEVDGYHYIEDINITAGRKEPIRISLCSPTEFRAMVEKLAEPYIKKAREERAQEIALLERENRATKEQLQLVEDKYQIAVSNYNELAEKFARIDPEFADERLKEALKCFEQGDIEKAKKYLPAYEQAINNIKRERQTMSLWLSIRKTEGNISLVQQTYQDLLKYTGEPDEKFKLLTEYSEYLFLNRIFDYNLLNLSLKKAEEANYLSNYESYELELSDKIYSYNLLGKIQKEQKNNNYFNCYKIAIDIFKNQTDNGSARKNIAISYIQLADYYKYKNNYRKTEDNYLRALDIYIEMYNNKESDNFNQIEMLISLAAFYTEANKYDLVKQCNDRIAILSKTISDPDKQAELNYKMGYFYMVGGQYYASLNTFNEALEYYEKKSKESALLYENKVLATNLLIALVYSYKYDADHNQTIRYCNEVIERVKNMNSITPEYFRMKGFAHALTANAHKQLGNKEEYKDNLDEAKDINKKINDKELASFIRFSKNDFLYSSDFNVWLTESLGFGLWAIFFIITMV